MNLSNSTDGFGENLRVLLMGPPKAGKTVTAATISEKFPTTLPATGKVVLDDILYWQFDSKGTESLLPLGLEAPVFKFDEIDTINKNTGKTDYAAFFKGLDEAHKQTATRIADGCTKAVIIDTLSALDAGLLTHYDSEFTDPKMSQQKFGAIWKMHSFIAEKLKSLPCHLIVLCHSKYKGEPVVGGQAAKDEDKLRRTASLMNPGATIVPQITGRALSHWEGLVSAIWPVSQIRGLKGEVKGVYVQTIGGGDYECGTRYTGLAPREPANLYQIFNKVKNGVSK